jgi:hypothetical protein
MEAGTTSAIDHGFLNDQPQRVVSRLYQLSQVKKLNGVQLLDCHLVGMPQELSASG